MNISVQPGIASTGAEQNEMGLVARVAAARVMRAVEANPSCKSLFSIVGLDKELTCAVARSISDLPDAYVRVHADLDDGSLPESMITLHNTTDFRNMPRSDGGGCIVFATPTRDLDSVGATAGEIAPLSMDTLASDPELWIEECSELNTLQPRLRADLVNFALGLHQSGVAVGGLRMIARFFLALDRNYTSMGALERALDESLPALRIGRNSGRFREPGQKGRLRSPAKWSEVLRELQKQTEDAVQLVNDRGVELERGPLHDQIENLETAGRLTTKEAETLRDLVNDVAIEPGVEWRASQDAVVHLSWDKVELVFRAPKKTRKQTLGDETLAFFTGHHPRELTKPERQILQTLQNEDVDPDEEEKEFFFNRRDHIVEDKRLLKRWESFIFRRTAEHADLLAGLLATVADLALDAEAFPDKPKVLVRMVGADKKSFWKNKNAELSSYLRDRYRGLDQVLKSAGVVLDFGMLWSGQLTADDSSTKSGPLARQFKIDVFLLGEADFDEDGFPLPGTLKAAQSRQLIWSMPVNSLASSFSANLLEIMESKDRKPLPIGRFSRAQRSERIVEEGIDLQNRGSIQDVNGKPDGVLVDANQPQLDAATCFLESMERVTMFLPEKTRAGLAEAMEAFRAAYLSAIEALTAGDGLASPSLFDQAIKYGDLLSKLRREARQDECRKHLWEPILLVGVALSEDRPEVAIVTPWQPFRLAEAATKARRVAGAIERILASSGSNAASIRRFARGIAEGIAKPWHPSIVVKTDGPVRNIFVESDTCGEFSLLESPIAGEGNDAAFDGYSREAANELIQMSNEYLSLQPHERANFSVSLFNADNRELPARLAEMLARKIETEADLRCDLILTHTDQQRLRRIYAEQNVAISRELDGALAGEATKSFLSRLRVGFLDADAVAQTSDGRSRVDIIFLHDVIARSAKLAWRRVDEQRETFIELSKPEGEASSRKRPFESGALKTEVYLTPNERPIEVQAYLDLLHDLHQDEPDEQSYHYAPVREIVFDDSGVGEVIKKAHAVGNWVVTFDAIADRQLLLNNDVSVIRFLPKPGLRHNVIVSTNRHGRTLTIRLADLLGSIADLKASDRAPVASSFIDAAAKISGKVVLHAARNEQNANELVGLVLSRRLVETCIGEQIKPVAWLLIDDFAEWIAHPPGKRADILMIGLSEEMGRPIIDLLVVESKFVGLGAETQEAKDALQQLRATTDHLRDNVALGKDPLNRMTWLSRLADLVAEQGVFDGPIGGRDAATWASTLRANAAILRVRGVALIFTHDRREGKADPFPTQSEEQAEMLFDRHDIAQLIQSLRGEKATIPQARLPKPVSSDGAELQDPAPEGEIGAASPDEITVDAVPDAGTTATIPAPPQEPAPAPAPSLGGSGLPPPVVDVLKQTPVTQASAAGAEWLVQTRQKLRVALRNYGLDADVIGERLTPNAALVRFKGSDKLTVADIEKKQEVLLTSHGLDVVGIHPEKGEVIVMVAREQRAFPTLSELWLRRALAETVPEENTSFLLGERENDGEFLYLNLAKPFSGHPQHGPHTLIAGETGSGKGVLTRNLILDICSTNSPRNAQIRMIDPKSGGDYPWIESLPHLVGGLVSTQADAIETLKDLVAEMEARYSLITKVTSNIDRYNAKMPSEKRLPRVYLFHDEMGDWMADKDHKEYREAVESYVARLGMKARAAGIHLFLITQRPDKDALPGPVKANMNNKVCLRVSSATNSRIVLDEGGAERLLGSGHFAAKLANERPSYQTSLIYAQAPFLDDDAAFDLAAAIRSHWTER